MEQAKARRGICRTGWAMGRYDRPQIRVWGVLGVIGGPGGAAVHRGLGKSDRPTPHHHSTPHEIFPHTQGHIRTHKKTVVATGQNM